ncbi:hypothetical protein D915_002485 [Fasciola hepatica]|uniref:Uncharacterized protein n=1 Tax=Fasciola hepatica TaxID=6192 RepID=A0A4E0S1P8_FASHE|nr:hypothetical protein D915_002485 [Fasciola hepatica]
MSRYRKKDTKGYPGPCSSPWVSESASDCLPHYLQYICSSAVHSFPSPVLPTLIISNCENLRCACDRVLSR